MSFATKDSGERVVYPSGALREPTGDRPRYELIPPGPLRRVAELYARGAVKYDSHNWALGLSTERTMASLLRHVESYRCGDRGEDHLAAVVWNAFTIMYFEDTEHDDLYQWRCCGTPPLPPDQ